MSGGPRLPEACPLDEGARRRPHAACPRRRTFADCGTACDHSAGLGWMNNAMTITGRCLCGAVHWASSELPVVTRVCWCRDCQYLGAGSGTVNACFRTSAFSSAGETTDYFSVADSGNRMRRQFCRACGTPLFSEAETRPHLIFVRVGTFDEPGVARPALIMWTASAPTWACFDPGLPQVAGQPPPAA